VGGADGGGGRGRPFRPGRFAGRDRAGHRRLDVEVIERTYLEIPDFRRRRPHPPSFATRSAPQPATQAGSYTLQLRVIALHAVAVSTEGVTCRGGFDGACRVPHGRCRRFQGVLSRGGTGRCPEIIASARLPDCGPHVPRPDPATRRPISYRRTGSS